MDPRRLVIFHTVVQKGSIGAAARELGWTQPAVSQHLAALEKDVGMQLLLRSPGGVTPTEAGARLAVHASAVNAHMEAAREEMEDITALKKGRVRFAAFPSASAMFLPPTLAHMRAEYPGVEISFVELEPPEAVASVLDNDTDVAMVFRYSPGPGEGEAGLDWTPVLADPLRVVLQADHPLASAGSVDLADFAEDEWVAGCERCRANLMESAQSRGFTPHVRFSTDDSTVVQRLVAQNPGVVALMPEIALEAYPQSSIATVEVTDLPNREIGIVTRPGALKIPAVAAFVASLRHNANAHGCTLTHAHTHLDTDCAPGANSPEDLA